MSKNILNIWNMVILKCYCLSAKPIQLDSQGSAWKSPVRMYHYLRTLTKQDVTIPSLPDTMKLADTGDRSIRLPLGKPGHLIPLCPVSVAAVYTFPPSISNTQRSGG